MNKLLLIPKSMEEIKNIHNIDGYIIGFKNYSVNMNLYLDVNELKNIDSKKEIFVAINKNMENKDIEAIKKILPELNDCNIKGILIYDVGIINLYNSLNLNYDLILSQEHLATNFNTINLYSEYGVKGAYLSTDITKEEIEEIRKNTNIKLMVNVFGYVPMFVSKRHIVKNYLDYFKLTDSSYINYMKKEGNIYPIIDNEIGTICYTSNILNGLKESLNLNVDYKVINSFNIPNIETIISIFKNVNEDNVSESVKKVESLYSNLDSGFLNTKTIYRVKKNEK